MLAPANVCHEAASSGVERNTVVGEENALKIAIFPVIKFPAVLFLNLQYSTMEAFPEVAIHHPRRVLGVVIFQGLIYAETTM